MSPQRPSPKCEKGRTGLWRACPGAPVHLFVDHDSDITQNWDESSALLFGLFSRSKSSLCGGPWRPSQLKVKVRTFFAEVEFLSRDASGRCVCVCVCVRKAPVRVKTQRKVTVGEQMNTHTHTEADIRCKLAGRAAAASRPGLSRFLPHATLIIHPFYPAREKDRLKNCLLAWGHSRVVNGKSEGQIGSYSSTVLKKKQKTTQRSWVLHMCIKGQIPVRYFISFSSAETT